MYAYQEFVSSRHIVLEDPDLVLRHPVGQVLPLSRAAVLSYADVLRLDVDVNPDVLVHVDNSAGPELCLHISSTEGPSEVLRQSSRGGTFREQLHSCALVFRGSNLMNDIQRPWIDLPIDLHSPGFSRGHVERF